jgi:protein-S-isoprenylcysteine O-methyltransferase Ste14
MPQRSRGHALELKVPPLVTMLLTAALMWLVSWATPALRFAFPVRTLLALSFLIIGVIISVLGVASFWRAKTTVNPMTPHACSSLVSGGIYTLTRNPMYLGFLFALVGWAIFWGNILAFFLLPAFIVYMNRFQIQPEERALTSLFGQQFSTYKSRVRRWL